MVVNLIRKPTSEDLCLLDKVVIEKVVIVDDNMLKCVMKYPLDHYDFIIENKDIMYLDKDEVNHCIFVTSKESDVGLIINSVGFDYCRYACTISKELIKL